MSEPTEVWQYDAVGQAELIANGDIAPTEAVDAAIERARLLDPQINSIVHERFNAATAEAADLAASSGDERKPFGGVPFAVKDWKCMTAGEPSTWGMSSFVDIDRRAEFTTELADRYRRAGLVTIGRTNLPELAFGPPTTESDAHGACRNPWALDRSVGGSSGGSGAVVAAGIVPAANASDGGGSLRIPAACNGLIGLKVSRGRISNAPHPDGRGAKVEGHIARTVRDVAALLDATAGALPGEPYGLPLPDTSWAESSLIAPTRLRIGTLDHAPRPMAREGTPSERGLAALATASQLLEDLGHHLADDYPAALDTRLRTPNLYSAERAALRSGIEASLGRPLTEQDIEPRSWAMFEMAASSAGPTVIEEMGQEQKWARDVSTWWRSPQQPDGFDLLLTPALGRDVPALGELKETVDEPLGTLAAGLPLAWFTYPFNVSGHPAIVVPILPADGDGALAHPPTAVQLVAAHGREDLLLAVAACLQSAVGWTDWWSPTALVG